MKERFPVIGGYRVDLEALKSISHRCEPTHCDDGLSCCACYDVELSAMEARRMVDWLPEAAKFFGIFATRANTLTLSNACPVRHRVLPWTRPSAAYSPTEGPRAGCGVPCTPLRSPTG